MPADFVDMTAIQEHLQRAGVPADLRQVSRSYFWLFVGNQVRTDGPGEPLYAPVVATGGRLAADGRVHADVEKFAYGIHRQGNFERFHPHSSDGTYYLTAAELAEHIAELVETVPALAGLCWVCGATIMAGCSGWEHVPDDAEAGASHRPSPRYRTVAHADVWDIDAAAAGKYSR
jgi:hypothetical protein